MMNKEMVLVGESDVLERSFRLGRITLRLYCRRYIRCAFHGSIDRLKLLDEIGKRFILSVQNTAVAQD